MLRLGGDVLGLAPCLSCWPPRPRDPAWACLGWRALAGLQWSLARGRGTVVRLGSPCPPPPLRGCQLAAPQGFPPLGVEVPLLVPAVMPSWASHPLPVPGRRRGGVGGGGLGTAALPSRIGGRKAEGPRKASRNTLALGEGPSLAECTLRGGHREAARQLGPVLPVR